MDNAVDYEFQDLVNKIQTKLREKEGWGDAYESSVGQTLIDINAEAADILSYMLERRSQEGFQSTARLRSSVVSKASENGYRPFRSIASSGFLQIELVDENGDPKPVATDAVVTIPENEIITFNNETFIATETATVKEGETTSTIPVIEGEVVTRNFNPDTLTSLSSSGYILIEDYEEIAEGSISVTSGGVEYEDVRDRSDIGSLSFAEGRGSNPQRGAFYDIRYVHDGMRIQFGDNVFGRRPASIVTVRYVVTKGSGVRVVSTGNEFALPSSVLNDDLNLTPPNEYDYVLTNSSPIVNGREAETIEEIKLNSPLSIQVNNRAVGLPGYQFWARQAAIGGVIDVNAFSERELDTILYNVNNVYISYLLEQGGELETQQKQQLIEFIKARDVALAHIVLLAVKEIKLGIEVDFQRNPDLPISNSELYDIISAFLKEKFRRRNGSIGNEFQKSDIINEFYQLTTRSGGINYKITDFVNLSIRAYQDFIMPLETNRALVKLDPDLAPTAGQTFILKFDDEQEVIVEVETDDVNAANPYVNLLFKMRDKIYEETNLIPEIISRQSIDNDNVLMLSLSSRDNLGEFKVSKSEGDLAPFTLLTYVLQVTPKEFGTDSNVIEPGTLEVRNETGAVVYTDNGTGQWVDDTGEVLDFIAFLYDGTEDYDGSQAHTGATFAGSSIEYDTGRLFLPEEMLEGNYTVSYTQDKFQNFKSNPNAAVTLIDPKPEFENVEETETIIRLL